MDPAQDSDPRDTDIVAVLAAARERDRAPASLRARVEHERSRAHAGRSWRSGPSGHSERARPVGRRLAAAGALAVLLAVLALSLNLVLPSHAPSGLAQAAALATRGPSEPAPAITQGGQGTRLGTNVDEVYFPDWHQTVGWRAVGMRTDQLDGRRAVTVYYLRGATQVAYTIVATPPLTEPAARQIRAHALTVHALRLGGRTVVTWRRAGDTCVLSSTGLSAEALAALASWSDQPGTE